MQVIQDEHEHFTSDGIDNEEHIPRIVRIAESAGKLLKVGGMPKHEVEANIQRIIGQVQGRPLQPSASTSITVTW